jgi:hypothetical protein
MRAGKGGRLILVQAVVAFLSAFWQSLLDFRFVALLQVSGPWST